MSGPPPALLRRLLQFLATGLILLGAWGSVAPMRDVVAGLRSYAWPTAELTKEEQGWSFANPADGQVITIVDPQASSARYDRDWQEYNALFEKTQRWWAHNRQPPRVYVNPADPRHPVLVRGIPPQSSGRLLLTSLLLIMGLRLFLDLRRGLADWKSGDLQWVGGKVRIPVPARIALLHLGAFGLYAALAFCWSFAVFLPMPGTPALLGLAALAACELVPGVWLWLYSFEAVRGVIFELLLIALLPLGVALLGLGLPFVILTLLVILLGKLIMSLVLPRQLPGSLLLLLWVPLYVAGCAAAFRALCFFAYRLQPLIPYHVPASLFGDVNLVARFDVVVGIAGVIVALGTVSLDTFWLLRQARQLANLPTSKARAAALGIAEFRGHARRLDGAAGEVLSWRMDGIPHLEPFYLEDSSGRILIDPRGAKFRVSRASSYGGRIVEIVLTRRTTQPELTRPMAMRLLAGDPLYVIGNVMLNPDASPGALGSERLVVKPLVEPGVVNVFVSLLLGKWSIPAARRIEHVFFLSDGSEQLARRHILKGLAEIWPKALLAAALSLLLVAQQLPRGRGGIEQWTGVELLRAPLPEVTRIELLVDYLLGASPAAQREHATPLHEVLYARELLRVRKVVEQAQITNYLWNNVRGPEYHFAAPALARLLEQGDVSGQRRFAARALGSIGPAAAAALPVLEAIRDERDVYTKREVESAVRRISRP